MFRLPFRFIFLACSLLFKQALLCGIVFLWRQKGTFGDTYQVLEKVYPRSEKYGGKASASEHSARQRHIDSMLLFTQMLIVEFLVRAAPLAELVDPTLLAMRMINLNFGSIHTRSVRMPHDSNATLEPIHS